VLSEVFVVCRRIERIGNIVKIATYEESSEQAYAFLKTPEESEQADALPKERVVSFLTVLNWS